MEVDESIEMSVSSEAQQLLTSARIGSFPSMPQLMSMSSNLKTRSAFDIAYPTLLIERDLACFKSDQGHLVSLFCLDSPLIEQLIFLKYFLCPENFGFYIQWIGEISKRSATEEGRKLLFGGSDSAELWFSQKLQTMDMSNPIQGALSALKQARGL